MGYVHVETPRIVKVIAIVMTLFGLCGVYDMISFYAFGYSSGLGANLSFTMHWDPNFNIYVDVLGPGVLVGPGLWFQDMIARVAALGLSLVWAALGTVLCAISIFELLFGHVNVVGGVIGGLIFFFLTVIVIACSIWQFNVLRSDKIRELFEGPELPNP